MHQQPLLIHGFSRITSTTHSLKVQLRYGFCRIFVVQIRAGRLRGILHGKRLNCIEFLLAALGRFRQGHRQLAILKQWPYIVTHCVE